MTRSPNPISASYFNPLRRKLKTAFIWCRRLLSRARRAQGVITAREPSGASLDRAFSPDTKKLSPRDHMLNSTVKQLASDLAAKRVSSVEVTQYFINRIKLLGGVYNAFISVDEEKSLAAARAADQLMWAGQRKARTAPSPSPTRTCFAPGCATRVG